jgi:hypothetical protein
MKLKMPAPLSALVLASALALSACASAPAAPTSTSAAAAAQPAAVVDITREEVLAAQKAWGDALVSISTIYDEKGFADAKAKAEAVLDGAYGYNLGPVLFKPTLTVAPTTFRTTRDGALAYFVGGDTNFPTDTGFALKHWRKHSMENVAIFLDDDVAISMGNLTLTDRDGNVTVVDKTWGYKRDAEGNLRIVLHHSSLPYKPN